MRSWDDYKKTMVQTDHIWLAAKEGRIARIQEFLAEGVQINAKDHRGYSPLMLAAYSDQIETVDWLIDRGADPNSADFGGNTVLMGAAFKGHKTIMLRLLNAGANPDLKNLSGMDALDFAMSFGRHEVVNLLKQHSSDHRPRNRLRSLLGIVFGTSLQPLIARFRNDNNPTAPGT